MITAPLALDDPDLSEKRQMLGDGRLVAADHLDKLADAALTSRETVDDHEPCLVGERAEHAGVSFESGA
jgi:hypothetical protein